MYDVAIPGSVISVIWYAGIACKGGAACRMAYNGLSRRLPLVFIFLAISTIGSIVLAFLQRYRQTYVTAYSIHTPLSLLAESAAIVSVFWAMTANCTNFRKPGSILLNALGIAGVSAAVLLAFLAQPMQAPSDPSRVWDGLLLLIRYVAVAQAVILIGALMVIPRSERNPLPKIPRRAALILALNAISSIAVSWLLRNYAFRLIHISQLIPVTMGLILSLLWLLSATGSPEADELLPPSFH